MLDLGCGEGSCCSALLADPQFTEIVGVDVSPARWRSPPTACGSTACRRAGARASTLLPGLARPTATRASTGYDAAAVVEVIEHLDPPRLARLRARCCSSRARPATVVVDHAQRRVQRPLRAPARRAAPAPRPPLRVDAGRVPRPGRGAVAGRHGYTVRFVPVGPEDPEVGPPTQMAVFRLRRRDRRRTPAVIARARARGPSTVPELSLVVLIGASGSGKSTFARRHFRPTEVLSSDACRGLVADDENDQARHRDAFDVLHFIAAKRLAAGRLTVVDATNVQPEARQPLVALAREHHVPAGGDRARPAGASCATERNRGRARPRLRPARRPPPARAAAPLAARPGAGGLPPRLRPARAGGGRGRRRSSASRCWNDRRDEHGPFDIVGDVHGCCDELVALLATLGYDVERRRGRPAARRAHPAGRKAVFVGDLVDRGPRIAGRAAPGDGHGRGRRAPCACPATTTTSCCAS